MTLAAIVQSGLTVSVLDPYRESPYWILSLQDLSGIADTVVDNNPPGTGTSLKSLKLSLSIGDPPNPHSS